MAGEFKLSTVPNVRYLKTRIRGLVILTLEMLAFHARMAVRSPVAVDGEPALMFGARSAVIRLDSTCDQNNAQKDSSPQSYPGALPVRLAWLAAYKIFLLSTLSESLYSPSSLLMA